MAGQLQLGAVTVIGCEAGQPLSEALTVMLVPAGILITELVLRVPLPAVRLRFPLVAKTAL